MLLLTISWWKNPDRSKFPTISSYCNNPLQPPYLLLLVSTFLIGMSVACIHTEEWMSYAAPSLVQTVRYGFQVAASLIVLGVGWWNSFRPGLPPVKTDATDFLFHIPDPTRDILHLSSALTYLGVFTGMNWWFAVVELGGDSAFIAITVVASAVFLVFGVFQIGIVLGLSTPQYGVYCFLFEFGAVFTVTLVAVVSSAKRNNTICWLYND